ncbi:hypothetical protein ACFYE2_00640 [Kocuria sp. CPCC 205300]
MTESLDRTTLARRAIAARSRGDWQAEREALDATHLLDQEEAAR